MVFRIDMYFIPFAMTIVTISPISTNSQSSAIKFLQISNVPPCTR